MPRIRQDVVVRCIVVKEDFSRDLAKQMPRQCVSIAVK